MELRSFRNTDPPAIVGLWNRLPPLPLRAHPLTLTGLELHVLSKPNFDPHGLILTWEGGELRGMIHATVAPAGPSPESREGVILILAVPPQLEERQIAAQLIAAAEDYLRSAGARTAVTRNATLEPMYLGLYGGSDRPGVLASDPAVHDLRAAGYLETGRVALWRRSLAGFRPVVDLVQRRLRQSWRVEVQHDPPPRTEAEAFALVHADHSRYRLAGKDGTTAGSCVVWDMEPLASCSQQRLAGLILIEIDSLRRKAGLATLLVGEALQQAAQWPQVVAHAQWDASDQACQRLFKKLGFERFEDGIVLRKELAS